MTAARTGPLTWMRVVQLTDLRGALCARILADLGADVLAVRRLDVTTPPGSDLAHRYRNANKGGVDLDPGTPAGAARLDGLLGSADVLVENLDPGDRQRLDLLPESVAPRHPHLVHVALTDLGLDGPRAGWRLEPLPALAAGDPGFRLINADVVRSLAADRLADRTRQQLFDEALSLGTTVGVLHRPLEYVDHPQTRSRGFFVATAFPEVADAPFASFPAKLSRTPPSLHRPAPEPGADDAFAARAAGPAPAPFGGRLLLEGVRIVEFGAAAVVPEMSGVLSELGAEVIRVESNAHPDVLRFAAGSGTHLNRSFAFNAENRGRKSVTVDLTTEDGRRLAFDLCAAADVVAENQRGGVLDGLGLGFEHVRAVNPGVVYASSQGYGRGGPLGEMPAYGPLNAGFAGVHLLWNHPDAPYPCGTSLNHPDHIAGKLMAVAVLAALDHRRRTGEGQLVDLAQTEAAAYLIGEVYLAATRDGVDPELQGNRSDAAVPRGVYPSTGEDRWIAVEVADDDAWQRLAAAAGWDDGLALATLDARLAARDEIDDRLASWTRRRPADETAEMLQGARVSAMPVMGPLDHHADPHLTARRFIVTPEHPEVGPEKHVGNPLRMSALPQRVAASAPCLGADTAAVLTDVLGLTGDEIARLDGAGVLR